MNTKTEATHPTDRVLFNWGYHDGARTNLDISDFTETVWGQGYMRGKQDSESGEYSDDSTAAWESYCQSLNA